MLKDDVQGSQSQDWPVPCVPIQPYPFDILTPQMLWAQNSKNKLVTATGNGFFFLFFFHLSWKLNILIRWYKSTVVLQYRQDRYPNIHITVTVDESTHLGRLLGASSLKTSEVV